MSFQDVTEFNVRQSVIDQTERALRQAGAEGFELFVFWTGRRDCHALDLSSAYIPRQRSFREHDGLHVEVGADALHQLNMWLFQNEQALAVQVHSHPGTAYHSDIDNAFPIVTALGGLSLVVPLFCRNGLSLETCVGYRLDLQGWTELTTEALMSLVRIVN
jgi:hypothetical protein